MFESLMYAEYQSILCIPWSWMFEWNCINNFYELTPYLITAQIIYGDINSYHMIGTYMFDWRNSYRINH